MRIFGLVSKCSVICNNRMVMQVPEYLTRMALRHPPSDVGVVPGSTPVIAFGQLLSARAATLAINPSSVEFCKLGTATILDPTEKRLADLQFLGLTDHHELRQTHAEEVVKSCFTYFDRRPYRWFDTLEEILLPAGLSYYDGTLCHLDIVQWATYPVWGKLPKKSQEELIRDGAGLLEEQLATERLDTIIVNGLAAWNRLVQSNVVQVLHKVSHLLPDKSTSITLQIGSGLGATFIGWTQHLQVMKATTVDKEAAKRLACEWIKEYVPSGNASDSAVRTSANSGVVLDSAIVDGFFEPVELPSLGDLQASLVDWISTSTQATIGNVGAYGRRPIIRVDLGDGLWAGLNADTTRDGVRAMLAAGTDSGGRWRIVANRNGLVNKVEPVTTGPSIRGWYFYLERPLDQEKGI